MRFSAVLLVAFACSGAFASEPGQPLDCSDMTFDEPGLTCRTLAPFGVPATYGSYFSRGSNIAIDNEGWLIIAVSTDINSSVEIRRTRDGGLTDERLAKITFRSVPPYPPSYDKIMVQWPGGASALDQRITFDPVHGRLIIPLTSYCEQGACPGTYGGEWMAAIEGFATLFDVLQTYTPQPSLGFRVPYMPEGLPAADHFDTYWGSLTHPLDFTQAHPLQCNYPAAAPHVGDYLTVADTVPTPAPGQGVYYVTSATYQGATRYGRKTTAGHLTGRDPALLPACTP